MLKSLRYGKEFEELYTGNYSRLYYYAYQFLNDAEVSRDVVNATIGTATDVDGNFTLRVPEDVMTLEVGFVGMKTQLVSIKDKAEVRVVMEEDNTVLEDVVVTGIFKKAKESYTGAVSSISSEQLKMYKGQNEIGRAHV